MEHIAFNGIMPWDDWREDDRLKKRERVEAAIAGDAVDRIPVSAWRHHPVDDQSPGTFAAATLAFQREFDFDFVKVTPASSYCLREWGVRDSWRGHAHGTREYNSPPINSLDDWGKIAIYDPRVGDMGKVLSALELIGAQLEAGTPFIPTIFSPLSQARNLAGDEKLLSHMRQEPDVIRGALQVITEQTLEFLEVCRATNMSGIFYAVQWASYVHLSETEYGVFGRPYDLQILRSVSDLWLNVLHMHGNDIMFEMATEYPAAIMNWHDMETEPNLRDGLERWSRAVCGGIRQEATLVQGSADEVRKEALKAIKTTGGRRLVLGTGCVTPIVTPYGNLRALRTVVEDKEASV